MASSKTTSDTVRIAHEAMLSYFLNVQATLSDLLFGRPEPDDSWGTVLGDLSLKARKWHGSPTWFRFRIAADELKLPDSDGGHQCFHAVAFSLAEDGMLMLAEIANGGSILKFFPDAVEPWGEPEELQERLYREAARAASTLNAGQTNDSQLLDGPCGQNQWRHDGEIVEGTMQVGSWKMVKHLWGQTDRVASFDDLIVPVYADPNHLADDVAFGSMRREANKFFDGNGIPWRVTIKKATVSIKPAE